MSHEVVQVIKLIKYNRKSYEMISVTCKCMPTTVNTQEQTLIWNDVVSEPNLRMVFTEWTGTDLRIIPWFGLRIAYVSGPQRARIRIGSGSHQMNPKRCNMQPNIQININIHLTYSLAHWHMRVHSRSHTHASIHIPTPIPVSYTHLTLPTIYSV